jgi:Tc toxin complex TcA C-terminal TcB-binding domain/Neuraminidase-like domain/Salmonella virulence plasmid 28.1kDa A protein
MDQNWKIYEIRGVVTGRNGVPLSGARVVAWWKHIRGRTELVAGSTSERGTYLLRYELREDAPQPLLLIIEALSEHLEQPLLSPLTQAQKKLVINLEFEPRDQSEWAKLVRAIEPLLGGLKLSELVENSTHQDISFLAQELNASTETLMRIAISARLENTFQIPAAAFYAFLRQQIPAALPTPLLDASQNFTLIDPLVQSIASMIFGLSSQTQTQTLTAAIALDYVGTRYTKHISQIVSELQAHHTTDLLNQPYLIGNTTLAQLLDVAALPQAKQQTFAQALATNSESMRNFWRNLGNGKNGFTAEEASSIERTLSIGSFVKNYTPLIQSLAQGFASGSYQTLPDLARLTLKDWIGLVNQTGAPPSIDPAGTATPAEVFASVVYTRVTRAYPTAALSSRIATATFIPEAQQKPLLQFFQNNPSLELIKDNLPVYIKSQGQKAFGGISDDDQAAVIANARTFQRVLRVAPNADVAQTLLGLGINSATKIAMMGEQQFFLQATKAGLTKPEANHTYRAAAQRYASTVSTYMQLNRDSLGVWPQAMGSIATLSPAMQQAVQADPTLSTLFGSQDYCATDDCTSILSPAAYLCDLLLWLRNHPQGAQTALDVLDSRRPDIRHLLLNCPNTDTELPYIDLVNELLADKISPPVDPNSTTNPIWKQTSADISSTQLSAAPEYFNQAAFVALSQASYPQSLPYSTGLDGLRTYLQQWNLPLWQLRQALLPLSSATTDQQVAVAAERFEMSPHAQDLVANANFVTAVVAWNTANPTTDLVSVPAFLQAASLTYEQLLELLNIAWVQGGLGISIQGIDDTCMTSTQSLTPSPLDAGFLDRAHRFLRLWLATGYKMWELDLLLNSPKVGAGALNQAALIALLSFCQLQDATRLSVDQLLAFYQEIDTASHRDPDGSTTTSLYAQIFLNPTVTWIAPDPDMASLPTGGTLGDPVLSDHLKAIQPALGVSGADVATLFALTDNQLTLANLSTIYSVNALAVASKFSISNLLSVAGLLNPTAATPAAAIAPLLNSPSDTLAFLAQAKVIQQSGLTLDALAYLLTPPSSSISGGWATTTQMTQANIASTLSAVQTAVVSLLSASTTLTAPIDNLQTSITVVNGSGFPTPNFSVVIGSEILLVTGVSGVGNTTWTVVRAQQGTTAVGAASGAAVTPTGADLNGAVISAVAANAHTTTTTGLANDVSAFILNTFKVPFTTATLLSVLTDPSFTGSTNPITPANFASQFLAIQLFDKIAVLVRGLKFVAFDLSWLVTNAALYGGIDFTQLPVITTQPALSLSPLLTTLLTIKLARLWTAAPPSSPVQSLYDIIGGVGTGTLADTASTQAALAAITGWPLADIEAFAPALGLTFPASYTQPAAYDALRTLEAMSSAVTASGAGLAAPSTTLVTGIGTGDLTITVTSDIGFPAPDFYIYIGTEILLVTAVTGADNTQWTVSRAQEGTTAAIALAGAAVTQTLAAQIIGWATVPQDEVSAENLAAGALGALKAQQSTNDAWLALAPTLMNPIRENRSAALQAFLTSQRDGSGNLIYPDSNSLFNYFLIDVQMSSCQVTSRVVQAYIAVQIFVERCLMNLEVPAVVVNLAQDDTWNQWEWMSRYRIWEANREVFLYPENWLIESQRPNRTEIYQTFEQEVRQGENTTDYLETVVLNYIDRLDGLAHLLVTGTCEDPATGTIYVVARTLADPPIFYLRTYENGAWTGWTKITLDIKAHQVIPAVFRGNICLFWMDAKVATEPHQNLPGAQASSNPPSQDVERYVTLTLYFSIYRNGSWAAAQTAKGKLFDKPLLNSQTVSNSLAVEALYTLKVQAVPVTAGYGANLWLDVFRFGKYDAGIIALAERFEIAAAEYLAAAGNADADDAADDNAIAAAFQADATAFEANDITPSAVHVGRAVFDGRFSDLELNNLNIAIYGAEDQLLSYAQSTYGPDAQPLLPLSSTDPDLTGEPNLTPQSGALITVPASAPAGYHQIVPLNFTSASALEQNVGPLLNAATIPFRVVGPDTDLNFEPTSDFFFQDTRRSYWVESQKFYWTGSMWSPVAPSDPGTAAYQLSYVFHPFYHAFTRLFWNQLSAGGFDLLYDPNLQQNPDQIDPSGSDVFGFQNWYQPVTSRVWWDHDDVTGQDRQYLDFNYNTPFSVYNWELFYHIPLYIAQLLSQNQQFEDAQTWFHYIFNPTRQGTDPVPQRLWIPKPLHNLSSAQILQQQINNLLLAVNQGDTTAVAEVENWRQNSFNPFLLADLRKGVPYMKSTVMSYLDNLIAWGDNLFASESREALSEATLIYVIANEILGPTPVAVTPPPTADESFDQLEPALDAFANAMVEIENSIGGSGGTGSGSSGGIPNPQTFYFKIPSNPQLLGYWDTVADRLYKLRHCQSISGAPLQLALFDAPIDPGLLIAAQAAGVDLSSVLSDLGASLPNYRFTALYPQALDFVNAVRAYGASLQAALEKSDAGALSLLQQSTQQQLLNDGSQILDWQAQQAQSNIDAVNMTLQLANQKYTFANTNAQNLANVAEWAGMVGKAAASVLRTIAAAMHTTAAVVYLLPAGSAGVAGMGGTPSAGFTEGGKNAGDTSKAAGLGWTSLADVIDSAATVSTTVGGWQHRQDASKEAATEAQTQITQATAQLNSANLALQIAQQNQTLHQEQIDNIQKQIDFLNNKFTSDSLYDWMVSSLSATYFQSYQLAYQMCKQVERCYQYELGIQNSSFIQFGYWDSLHKGLLAGETLNHDLRRMQSSYLQQNARRYELSRFVSLATLDPGSPGVPGLLQNLLVNGWCDFTLPESLFDNDYPGHYNRRLTRVSMTVVYPGPGKFDNVKATLTLMANQVRVSTAAQPDGSDYSESPVGSDSRFLYNYGAVPQKIAMGNAQDDPGLFITAIASNIADQRYLPFENAGAVSSWHLEMPQSNNEFDVSTVGDVVLHLYYTALDGGATLQKAVEASNAASLPTSGIKVFSAQNDFTAPSPTVDNPYPLTPWQALVATQKAIFNATAIQEDGSPRWEVFNNVALINNDQLLTLTILPSKFPAWTRGMTISVTSLTLLAVAWTPGDFEVAPQSPLPTTTVNMTPIAGVTEPNVCAATISMPANTPLGTWSFKIKQSSAADFRSLNKNLIGDVVLLVSYEAS